VCLECCAKADASPAAPARAPQGEARRALERMYNKQERDRQTAARGGGGGVRR
jgi:hypothetical protein